MKTIAGMYGLKYNLDGEVSLFLESDGQIMQVELDREAIRKLVALLKAAELEKVIGGEK